MKILCFRGHRQESEKTTQNGGKALPVIPHEEYIKDCCESATEIAKALGRHLPAKNIRKRPVNAGEEMVSVMSCPGNAAAAP